jgi:alpha-L-rhamnosidase
MYINDNYNVTRLEDSRKGLVTFMKETKNMITPYGLKTEYLTNPLGIDVQNPRFSWLLKSESRGVMQRAYRVIVATDKDLVSRGIGDMWDSGKILSRETTNIEYAGKSLLSRTSYWWRVFCSHNSDLLDSFSEIAIFETALFHQSDFVNQWIITDETKAASILRREFSLKGDISQARAYICGLGYYEMYFNGQKVGDHVLDPNWTDFDNRVLQNLIYPHEDKSGKRALYVTYDITSLLKLGVNAVGIMLGNGWYNQCEKDVEGQMSYGKPRLWLQIHMRYEDGTEEILGSDNTWKCSKGPITYNNIYFGEIYDARLEQMGWNLDGFDDSRWDMVSEVQKVSGVLKAQLSPADKVISVIKPVVISERKKGIQIYDLGRNISGWARIRVLGSSGQRVVMRFAEELDTEGGLDFTSADIGSGQQIQQDIYILSGKGPETYEPHFTWHGFRYVEVTVEDGITMESLMGVVVHSDVKNAGNFSCSNNLFNRIFEIYRWSQLGNLHGGVPSDCPHRERLGYTGDAQITAQSAIFSFDMAAFYTKWIEDISGAQNPESGYVPHTVPFYGGGGGPGGWGSAAVLMPWYMFLYYKDKRILEKNYKMMLNWMEYMSRHSDADGIIISEELGSWCLGEWIVPRQFENIDETRDDFNIDVPAKLVNTFFYLLSASYMKSIAELLGDCKASEHFEALHNTLKKAMHKRFYNEKTGSYATGVQGSDVFPLAADCVPEENKGRVLANLVQNIMVKNNGHLDTGIFGTFYMLEVLTENGEAETAYTIMNQSSYPGYGYMLSQGATTLWEEWEKEHGSHNHPMFGSIVAWMFKYVSGLQPDKDRPGFQNIILRPGLFSEIDYAEASYESILGHIAIRWERQGTKMAIWIDIPCNCSADLYLPIKELDKVVEGGIPVFHNGSLLDKHLGILEASLAEEGVKVSVKSGRYHFEI